MVRPRKHSDEEILAAARAVFLEHGPGASTALVAEHVGLSQAALFKRFGTKETLMLRALLPPEQIPWVSLLESGPDDRPLPDQLREICMAALDFFATMIPCLMTLKASGIDIEGMFKAHPDAPPLRARRAAGAWFGRAMDDGRLREADPDRMALMLMGSLQARAFMGHITGDGLPPDERRAHADAVVDLLWTGIQPSPSDGAS